MDDAMDLGIDVQTMQKMLRDIELALNESSIVSITDTKGNIQFANKKFCRISKYSLEELLGSNQRIVNSQYHSRSFFKKMWKTIGNGEVWRGEIRNKAKDGSVYWVDTTIVPFLKDDGKPYQYIAIRHDITKRKEYEKKMRQMAYYDPLTGLPNRNYLPKWMEERPNSHGSFAVLFIDLDRFKGINDNYGHHIGDILLTEVASRLKHVLKDSDFISRQGGDEFIAILDNVQEKADVQLVVDKIIERISLPFKITNEQLTVTSSIGVSINENEIDPDSSENIERCLQEADTAMYHAKRAGGNRYCFNTPDQNKAMKRYYDLEQEIKHALVEGQFFLNYQPFIDLKSNKITGTEVLLRWTNPKLGVISPLEFIPILEELGYINSVGNWVLRTACQQMQTWIGAGLKLQKIAVNVSPIQFRSCSFIEDLKDILTDTGLEPQFLELEITENILLDIEKSSQTLKSLKELGVKVSIDDFGTGYSSLNYLKQLPIDTLKIDKSFIDELDADGKIIIDTIITMGSNLDFTIIAEGIENQEQQCYLAEQDCHVGQGYLFGKPVNADEFYSLYSNE